MSRRLAAIVALVVGAATIVLAVVGGGERVPARPGPAGLRGGRRRGRLVRRAAARDRARRRAGRRRAGARRRGGAARRGRAAGAPTAGGRRAAGHAGRGPGRRIAVHVRPAERARAPRRPVLFYNPQLRRRQGGALLARRRGARARDRADRADAGRGPRDARPRRGRPRRRRRSRWPAATARRRSSPRSPPSAACPTRASPPARATTSRSTSASTATTSSARSTRSSTAASARVDLAEVNGRVFVNNVSLGLYAEAVQRDELSRREAPHAARHRARRARPDGGEELDLRWTGPGGHDAPLGRRGPGLQQPLPARPRGRLGHAPADRRRPARDHGRRRALGARRAAAGALQRPWREWSAPTFEVDADRPVAAGIDGEALMLDPPLSFRIRPGVLRVRIARKHPGASPSATAPEGVWAGVRRAGADRPRREHSP